MDITAIIVAIFGSFAGLGGLITAIRGVKEYIDKRKGNTIESQIQRAIHEAVTPLLEEMEKQGEKIDALGAHNTMQDEKLKEIRLDTTRTQLYFKMEHDTHNHEVIFKIAFRYFVELDGDWVATVDFLNWAKKEGIEIPKPILNAITKNDGKKVLDAI